MCGPVRLTPASIRLTLGLTALYWFSCPCCDDWISHEADPYVITLLTGAGVVPEQVPAEALEQFDGPPINMDDVLDFALALHLLPEAREP
jgi:hypothetical protein